MIRVFEKTKADIASIAAQATIIDGLHDVPSANVTTNTNMRDVIGNKSDLVSVPYAEYNSIMAFLHTGYYHVHGTSFVFPNLDASVSLTKSATAWAEGDAATIIAQGATANNFDIHFAVVDNISANGQFQLNFYASDTVLIGSAVFSRSANFSQEAYIPIQIPQQAAGVKITAKLAGSGTGTTSCGIKISGHYYTIV